MEDKKTFEDVLVERGLSRDYRFNCPNCGNQYPPFAFVEDTPDDWICTQCYAERQKGRALPEPVSEDWDSELGNGAKAERTRLLEKWRWTVMPDSPLNENYRQFCMNYLKSLNRITVDFTTPASVVWPTEPSPAPGDYE